MFYIIDKGDGGCYGNYENEQDAIADVKTMRGAYEVQDSEGNVVFDTEPGMNYKFENRKGNKIVKENNKVRISESELIAMVQEGVKKVLNEYHPNEKKDPMKKMFKQANAISDFVDATKKEKQDKEDKLDKVIKESIEKVIKENTFRGVEGTNFIWHGTNSDPEIEYNDRIYNYGDIEDTLWYDFIEQTQWTDSDSGNPRCEAEFDKFCQENAPSLFMDLEANGECN